MSESAASAKTKAKTKTPGTPKPAQKTVKSSSETIKPSLNLSELRELAEMVNEHGFTDFEFENENIRVRLSKTVQSPVVQTVAPSQVVSSAPSVPAQTETASAETTAPLVEELEQITSPIVGTFYRSPSPDKDSYVKEGSKVIPETVVCIVEAMKLMNEIQAEATGEIVKIYVENGQPVEYGQPLFGIRK